MSFVNNPALALVALGLLLLAPRAAAACSCGDPSVRPCAAYWKARAVFTGVVTGVAESGVRRGGGESVRPFYYKLVRFRVQDWFRGPRGRDAQVLTALRESDCGYSFVPGRRYLVYAEEGADGRLYTSVCAATKPLAEAGADLSLIKRWPDHSHYGMYSNSLESYKGRPGYHEEWFLISGRGARLCTFRLDESIMNTAEDREFRFISAAYFPEVSEGSATKLSMWVSGKGAGEQEAAKKILQSVEFK